jgi:hypothetical protein
MTLRQVEIATLSTFCLLMLFSLAAYRAFQSIEPQPQRPISAAEVCR